MMLKYVEHNDIDLNRWDELLLISPNATIFNMSWYLESVSVNWDALILNDYQAIMPLPFTKKAGVKLLYQPFFSRQSGVFSGNKILTDDEKQLFFTELFNRFTHINIGFELGYTIPEIIKSKQRMFQYLDLSIGYESIYKQYSTNAKRILKKSNQYNFKLVENTKPEIIVEYFKKHKGKEIKDLKNEHFESLIALMKICLSNGFGKSWLVKQGEIVTAGGFFMLFKDRVTYLKGFSTETGKQSGSMYFLMDEVIKKICSGYQVLDFGGSDVTNVAQFYKKFGASDAFYLFLSRENAPLYFNVLKKLKNKLKGT